jgi:prophage regulatory protein
MTDQPQNSPQQQLLSYFDLKRLGVGFSRVHLARLERQGRFPRHLVIGQSTVRWLADEVGTYISQRSAERGR